MEDEVVNRGYLESLGSVELMAFPFYLFIIFYLSYAYQMKRIGNNPSYTYFSKGLMVKLMGALFFCLCYIYYYQGGDTIAYFESSRSFVNLLQLRPNSFLTVYFGSNSVENYSQFDMFTGLPFKYMYFEGRTMFVIKIIFPFVLLGFKSYLISTILLSATSFLGIWRMYQVFVRYYPEYYKQIAIGFLFLPTAIFWGSGILKDTITLTAFCWFVSSFEKGIISREKIVVNVLIALLAGYIILLIKPYILMACVPGMFAWMFHQRVAKIRNKFLKVSAMPIIYALSIVLGIGIMALLGDRLDKFSLNKVLFSAKESQMDLKNDAYEGHGFDIGSYDASVQGVMGKAPIAIVSGLFRPFIWEAKNFVMLLSALENLAFLYLFIYPFVKIGFKKTVLILFDNPLLFFLFSYSVFFAFSIGISTSNFGALVRFKIAFAPFLATLLLILYGLKSKKKVKKINQSAYQSR